ncbi:hypothetical protein LQ757_13425 [Agromyces sp. SYSU K20354]|uniref:hypothetical protein n=1 Tax=Agromyces cavernae TaxID=2898659 RepID=UPI001E2C1F32|nr:hypothetical protein [Agromyces cavernae]MCD2443279.1 hypothetical protein [Agromyces cavernae]
MRFRPAPVACALIAILALAACASPGSAEIGSTGQPSPTASAVSPPTPSPAPTVDPADVTTWTITAEGIGPIKRAAAYPDALSELTTFEAAELCPGAVELSRDATAGVLLSLSADGTEVATVWVAGRAGDDGVVPASPATDAGIRLGSSGEELAAAYPDLETVAQIGADTYGYAVGDDATGWIDFIVDGGIVTTIGSSERQAAPREFCG